ncbi:hypothetical protein [Nocardia sp. NPDC050710]|uniref:hypothetical protein n=1 Tax=Nocardia sp. NPDC050710 TaxID=3157220 RepID=UPI0033FCAC41
MVTAKTAPLRPFQRHTAALIIAGSLPLAVVCAAAPALATPPGAAAVVVDPQYQPMPNPVAAPLEVPDTVFRVGDVETARPDWVDPVVARQFNEGAAGMESGLSDVLDAAGVEPARSDRIADDVFGGAVIGAAVGATVASPLASTGAMVGAVAGFIAGIPFLPAGLVVVPIIGAVLGYAFVAAPAAVIGAAVGAAVGAVEGAITPLDTAPAEAAPAV